MSEIKKLNIDLQVEGWDKSGGKSFNVWGLVDFPADLLKYIMDYKKQTFYTYDPKTGKKTKQTGKRAPVWTAFDKFLYHDYPDKPRTEDTLPKISATFKSAFDHKFSPIVENMGMRIAMELDMPTSYNYIVSFDPEQYPQIIKNYPRIEIKNDLQPIGIVSLDFLQARYTEAQPNGQSRYTPKDEKGQPIGDEYDVDAFIHFDGDELITFEDALKISHMSINKLAGEENYIEKWIDVVDTLAREQYKHLPREELNKMIDGIHSRIARSFLLKDILLGDSDFTAYNGGIVANKHKMRYAATHDYGDICNSLITEVINFKADPYCGMTKESFELLPPSVQEAIKVQQAKNPQRAKTVKEAACFWASAASEQNFYYVLRNFPDACAEFFANVDKIMQKNKINNIVDSYTKMTCNGHPLLTKEEANMFKEYFYERISHFCELYVDFLNKGHQKIPHSPDIDDFEKEIGE